MSSESALGRAVAELIRRRREAASAGLPFPLPEMDDAAQDADQRIRFLASLLEGSSRWEVPLIEERAAEVAGVARAHEAILGHAAAVLAEVTEVATAHAASPSVHFGVWEQGHADKVLMRPQRRVLLRWLRCNRSHPYASPDDVEMLSRSTGLSAKQIRNFLVNARRRVGCEESPEDVKFMYPWMYG
uniref:Homeobox domain-containing protein n=1 Tax=Sexangularia sp. CB-2014 TaxID=1486929 RepID=A0A7S1VSX4_9EUKA